MVGGKVVKIKEIEDVTWINCQEYNKGNEQLYNNFCAIYVKTDPKSQSVSEGDIVWWQADKAYWTPKDKYGKTIGKSDIELQRIGFSGVSEPK